MSASAIYEGRVRHRRFEPVEHEFSYRHAMVYLDLDELPEALDAHPLTSARRAAPARFRRADHLGDPARPLSDCVRELVDACTGSLPGGPVRLLTTLRMFGHGFNPVSFYYCFDAAGEAIEAVVAEVNNTPWGERHCYVLRRGEDDGRVLTDTMDKAFHVSPFIGMENRYEWRVTEPGERLAVHIGEHNHSTDVFDATLSLERHELSRARLTGLLLRFPATSLRVVALIYWNALKLKLKGAPYYPHPVR